MSKPVCIITGASRGIGLAAARRMSSRGFAIVAVARGEADLASAVADLKRDNADCLAVAADITTTAACQKVIDAAISRFGRIDALVNNAGVAPLGMIADFTDDMLDQCIAVNIGGLFRMTRAAWPHLARQGGTIVNISSRGSVDPFPGFALYGASKTWVNAFTSAAAKEGAGAKIRMFSVAPGAVETELLRKSFPDFPKGRALTPDFVAQQVERCFDADHDAKNGQTIFVT